MASYSRSQLIRELAEDLFPDGFITGTVLVNGHTSAQVIPLTELLDNEASADFYKGSYLYVYEGTNLGDWRRTTLYERAKAATYGSVTVNRPLTATPDATTKVALWNGGLHAEQLRRIINKVLSRLNRETKLPYTLVTDGLMDDTTTASYTASNATLVKVTSGVFSGARALQVTNTGASGYAQTVSINVSELDQLRVEVVGRITNASGTRTARVQVVDADTGTVLGTAVTSTSRDQTRFTVTIDRPGAGVNAIAVRLGGDENGTITLWDELLVWKPSDNIVTLPPEVTVKGQVVRVERRRSRVGSGNNNTAEPYAADYLTVNGWDDVVDPHAASQVSLRLPRSGSSQLPLIVSVVLPWTEMASDSDTAYLNLVDFLAKGRAIAYEQLKRTSPHDDRKWYGEQAEFERRSVTGQVGPYQPRGARRPTRWG